MPGGHGSKSLAVREKAAVALASGESPNEAAAGCGVCVKTIYRWMGQADFMSLVWTIQKQTMDTVIHIRVETALRAAWRLKNLVGHKNARVALAALKLVMAQPGLDELDRQVRWQHHLWGQRQGDEGDGVQSERHGGDLNNGRTD
jgi:hypothetical protein